MNRVLIMLVLSCVIALVSCTKDIVQTNQNNNIPGTEVPVSITVQRPNQAVQVKAFENPTLTGMRIVLMVMDSNGNLQQELTQTGIDYSNGIRFDIRMVTGQTYKLACWADFGDNYYTLSLKEGEQPEVTTKVTSNSFVGSDNKRDAYCAIEDSVNINSSADIEMVLSRPFGLIKINALDYNAPLLQAANKVPSQYSAIITAPAGMGTGLNLSDGSLTKTGNVITIDTTAVSTKDTTELSFDYFFVEPDQGTESIIEQIEMTYYNNSDQLISTFNFTNIPIRRNYITNITGNLFTKAADINVKIAPEWTGDLPTTTIVSSAFDLKDAIKNSKSGDIIELKEGYYNLPYDSESGYLTVEQSDITIRGELNKQVVISSSHETSNSIINTQSLIYVKAPNFTMENISLQPKPKNINKTVELAAGGNIRFSNCNFMPNDTTPNDGGCLMLNPGVNSTGTILIDQCTFNYSQIYLFDCPIYMDITIQGCTFENQRISSMYPKSYIMGGTDDWNRIAADSSQYATTAVLVQGNKFVNGQPSAVNEIADALIRTGYGIFSMKNNVYPTTNDKYWSANRWGTIKIDGVIDNNYKL